MKKTGDYMIHDEEYTKAWEILISAFRDRDPVAVALAGHAAWFLFGMSYDELAREIRKAELSNSQKYKPVGPARTGTGDINTTAI